MAKDRLKLHEELVTALGSRNVYFQPGTDARLNYPCIIYKRDARDDTYANDGKYLGLVRYLVSVVDRNPDSIIPSKVAKFPYCSFQTMYVVDNLNHDVYSLYY